MLKVLIQLLVRLFGSTKTTQKARIVIKQPRRADEAQSSAPPPVPSLLEQSKSPEPVHVPLYARDAFDCSTTLSAAMVDLYPNGPSGHGPTAAQCKLILTSAGAQSVVAGAGSGKSTSLISRLLVMNKHLGVSLNNISVFTFTRNSRFDFIAKLVESAGHWGVELDEKRATKRVRTFHSKVLELCKEILPSSTQIFDMLEKVPKPPPGSAEELRYIAQQQAFADEADNPFDSTISNQQASILRDAYVRCYTADERFREAIRVLITYALCTTSRSLKSVDEDWNKKNWCFTRDEAQTGHAEQYWTKQGSWPIEGVQPAPRKLKVEETLYRASGYIEAMNVFVVLGCNSPQTTYIEFGTQRFCPYYAGRSKLNVLLRGCSEKVFFCNSVEDFTNLKELLLAVKDVLNGIPPIFRLVVPGDYQKSYVTEALYGVGVFSENLAIDPRQLASRLESVRLCAVERQLVSAVSRFFEEFRDHCAANGMRTFNELFFMLAPGSVALSNVPLSGLRSMQHLLIDEFQDISPLVIQFVHGVHRELATRTAGADRPTILVVGDDWQSVYGWRGSAPHFFLRFAQLFDGARDEPILLTDNFRSSQHIIDCAQAVLSKTDAKHRMDKTCLAKNAKVATLPSQVWLIEESIQNDIQHIVEQFLKLLKGDESILVLSRGKLTGDLAYKRCSQWRGDKRLRFMTVHKSKGLEADYVLVLDDMGYTGENPLRNAMYSVAGFKQSYDASQRDEAMRLAYVAVTRAKKLCIWAGQPREGAAMQAIPINHRSCRRGDVSQVLKALREG